MPPVRTTECETAIATARADVARADTKAQVASAAVLAVGLAIAPNVDQLTTAGRVIGAIAAIAALVALAAAGMVLWPRTGAPTGATLRALDAELIAIRELAGKKFRAIRFAYAATGITVVAVIAALAL